MPDAANEPRAPDLPRALRAEHDPELTDNAEFEMIELAGGDLSARWARNVSFEASVLRRTDFAESRFEQLRMTDLKLAAANLANIHAHGASLTRVMAADCRLTGANLFAARLTDVMIRGSRVDLASFGAAHLERVTFEDCMLTRTDFLDAQLHSVRFTGCDMTGVDLRGAKMRGCEVRRCDLSELQGAGSLRGTAMEWATIIEMAGVWAGTLGIEVLEDD